MGIHALQPYLALLDAEAYQQNHPGLSISRVPPNKAGSPTSIEYLLDNIYGPKHIDPDMHLQKLHFQIDKGCELAWQRWYMTQPPVILLALKPILRDEIEHVADLGWVTPIWTLREWVYKLGWTNPPPGALGIDMDKLNRHFDLLYIFTAAAAEDITEWTRQTLLYELKDALSLIKNSPYLATNEYQFLLIYDEVLARVELFSESSPAVDASVLLSLADTCFEIMVELERFPYPTLPQNITKEAVPLAKALRWLKTHWMIS